MTVRHTPQQIIATMVLAVICLLTFVIWLLYEVSVGQQRQRLVEIVQSNARLIEAIAEHESGDEGEDSTLEQVTQGHSAFTGLGQTGEFVLAKRVGDQIEILLSHRQNNLGGSQTIPFNSTVAEPTQRAVQHQAGSLIGLDYNGIQVLAAHEPINYMGWGIVAKIDMTEIRTPFIRAALLSSLAAVFIILLGSGVILRLTATINRELREAKIQQDNLFELSPIGLALCDLNGRMVEVNPAYAEIIGHSTEEALGLSCRDVTPAKYAAAEQKLLQQIRESGRYGPYEKEVIHQDGYLVPVRLSGKLIERDGKQYIWSSVEDISDKVCAEKRLRQAAAVFENTDEGIVITDENNRIIMVNGAFSEITGYTEEESLGHNPRILRSGKHGDTFYQSLWRHLEEEDRWRGEMWNRRKDGSHFPVWQHISVVRDGHGRLINYVSIFSDISELKTVEQQLSHLAHHDELTGLPNRLYYKIQLEKSLQSARRNQHKMALLFLDLDGFKQINDSFGHEAGDQLLREVATRLKNCVREEDMVARMGGDEFIILLAQIKNPDDAALVARNILAEVTRPLQLPQHTLTPSTSIGISLYPDDGESVPGLQKAADHAMYTVKGAGKNGYKFFTPQV
ncbi:MAG: diguanylate cyclase [Gammaproteobacteria bacterium]|nr:diguanylate cyclase [Gammaproteobacteria bacterium]